MQKLENIKPIIKQQEDVCHKRINGLIVRYNNSFIDPLLLQLINQWDTALTDASKVRSSTVPPENRNKTAQSKLK